MKLNTLIILIAGVVFFYVLYSTTNQLHTLKTTPSLPYFERVFNNLTHSNAHVNVIAKSHIYHSDFYQQQLKNSGSVKCIVMNSVGRLGNIMFQYAAAVGICIRRNAVNIDECAQMTTIDNEYHQVFEKAFHIYFDPGKCISETSHNFTEKSSLEWDPRAALQANATRFYGYYQSHLYFHPDSYSFLKSKFQFSQTTNDAADKFLQNVKKHSAYDDSFKIVCMSVRRGDKTDTAASNMYNKWALSLEYYGEAVRLFQQKYGKIALIIFAGGAKTYDAEMADNAWVMDNMAEPWQNDDTLIFFEMENNLDAFATLKVLTMCPNLIVASSSFSWWGAYLAGHSNVIAPRDLYSSGHKYDPFEYYPPGWTLLFEPPPLSAVSLPSPPIVFKNPPEPYNYSRGSNLSTVVTSYYIFPSKYNHTEYYLLWIANFMKMDFQCVIYVNQRSKAVLTSMWPATSRRMYIVKPINQFRASFWNWSSDLEMDPELKVGHSINLYKIWIEKIFMVAETVERNPFNTEFFAWNDIGCIRVEKELDHFVGFPDPTKFSHKKVTLMKIYPFDGDETENPYHMDNRFLKVARVGGGIFAGGGEAILTFRDIFIDVINEAKRVNVFAGKDQNLFVFSILRYPFLFDLIDRVPFNYDIWMNQHVQWSMFGRNVTTHSVPVVQHRWKKTPQVVKVRAIKAFKAFRTKSKGKICFLILSTPRSTATRDALRKGWLTDLIDKNLDFEYKFVMGLDKYLEFGSNVTVYGTKNVLKREIQYYDDIMLLPFQDDYWNLTLKVNLMLKIGVETMPNCEYFFKVDEDVHIKAKKIIEFQQEYLLKIMKMAFRDKKPNLVYGGYIYDQISPNRISEVSRDPSNRHSFTEAQYPHRYYEPYAGGPIYFLSSSLIKMLPYTVVSINEELIPSTYFNRSVLFKLEDVFMGTLVQTLSRSGADINFVHVKNLLYINQKEGSNKEDIIAVMGVKKLSSLRNGKAVFL